jgi:hypothetical protein
MGIITKHGIYQFATFAWALGVAGSIVLILSGNAEPYVSPAQLPIDGPLQMFGTAVVLIIAGVLLINQFEKRSWKRAGRHANLTPSGRSLIGKPDLEGEIDGHTVRARTIKRKTSSSGDEGSNKSTFTVIEAGLASHANDGLILGGAGDSGFESGPLSIDLSTQGTTVADVTFLGNEELGRDVVTARVSDALGESDQIEAVFAGDTDEILLDAIPNPDGGIAGAIASKLQDGVKKRLPGGPGTVSTEQRGVVLDGAELQRQTAAVAAVADSFDRAVESTATESRSVEST